MKTSPRRHSIRRARLPMVLAGLVVPAVALLAVVADAQPAAAQYAFSLGAGKQTDQTATVPAPTGLSTSNLNCPTSSEATGVPLTWTGSTALDADGHNLVGYYGTWRSVEGAPFTQLSSTTGSPPVTTFTDDTASDALPSTTFFEVQGNDLYSVYNGQATRIGVYKFGTEENLIAGTPDGTRALVAESGGQNVLEVGALYGSSTYDDVESTITLSGNGSVPIAVAIAPNGSDAYVLDGDHDEVDVVPLPITASTYTVPASATIAVGDVSDPAAMTVTPSSSQLLVANYYSGTVSVISTSSGKVTATVTLPRPRGGGAPEPSALVVGPSGQYAYVLDSDNDKVDVVDLTGTDANEVTDQISVGKQATSSPAVMDVADNAANGVEVYVADTGAGTISEINEVTDAVHSISLGATADRPQALVAAPDGCYVAVAETVKKADDIAFVSASSNSVTSTETGAASTAMAVPGSSANTAENDGAIAAMPTDVTYELQAGASTIGGFLSGFSSPITLSLGRGQVP